MSLIGFHSLKRLLSWNRLLIGSLEGSGFWGPPVGLLNTPTPRFNSNRTSVVRFGRQKYERLYPVVLVQPDGSTINIRYKEPRRILTMPVNLAALSEAERQARQKKRETKKTKQKFTVRYEDDFSYDAYKHLWKKK